MDKTKAAEKKTIGPGGCDHLPGMEKHEKHDLTAEPLKIVSMPNAAPQKRRPQAAREL